MKRMTYPADFGLEEWEETLLFVESDPYGAYNIIDIAKQQGNTEFDEILKSVSLRLAEIENILSDENGEYDLDRLKERYVNCITLRDEVAELVKAKRDGHCFISDVRLGDEVYYIPKFNGNPCGGIRTGHVQAVAFTKAGKRIKIREYHAHNQDFMIGKTVFLTREAAEQALKEYEDGQRD